MRRKPPRGPAWGSVYPLLDLHGLTGDEAVRRASVWLRSQRDGGERTVVVVTGRGNRSTGVPVLRAEVEHLLDRLRGELVVRWSGPEGPRHGFFAGYLKNADATEEAWRGGWFHTGDVVRQAPDGMLYFVDRKKNIIRRSGENIAAAEVEAVIQTHPSVAQVAVLAVADDVREEEVMACVVPMPEVAGGDALAEQLFDWCRQRLAYFKAPGFILFVPALPTTGTQKVQKAQLFARGVDPRKQAGAIDLRGRKKRG